MSGCFSITCFVMAWTISSHDAADSFCSQGPPNDRHVIVFICHLGAPSTDAGSEWRGCWIYGVSMVVSALLDGSADQCRHHRLRFDADPAASCPGGPKFYAHGVSEKPLKRTHASNHRIRIDCRNCREGRSHPRAAALGSITSRVGGRLGR